MSNRQAKLRALGIETWALRSAPAQHRDVQVPRAQDAQERPQPSTASPPSIVSASPAIAEAPVAPSRAPAASWDALREQVAACRACRLCETRTQTVFGTGALQSPLMVVGEGPGADEDAQGDPFVGRAGKLLDEMLRSIGRARTNSEPDQTVYIANVVKCRPPGNREPAEDEAESCRPFLEAQLRLVKPKLIVALGRVAAQRLLVTDEPLSRLRGPLHRWGPEGTPLVVTYHPAYLLRSPGEKAKSWEDLKRIHQFLASAGA